MMRTKNMFLITLITIISQTFCVLPIMAWSKYYSIYYRIMCVNQTWVNNPYTGKPLFIKCGSCPACLHEKASKRVSRIENTRCVNDGLVCMFGTLTYTNDTVPYIKRSEYENFAVNFRKRKNKPVLRVYRDRLLTNHGLIDKQQIVKEYTNEDFYNEEYCFHEISDHLLGLRFKDGDLWKEDFERVGVCVYSDAQNFIKRVRQRLSVNEHYKQPWNYFICSEYGEHYQRPHFHVLFFVRQGDESIFERAFYASWPFHDLTKVSKTGIWQYARKPAKYVASYVNCISTIPQLLQTKVFRPTCRFSYGLGFNNDTFNYDTISKKIEERNLRYRKKITIDGTASIIDVPMPKYVVNRFFTKFKGFNKLTVSEVYHLIMSRGSAVSLYARKLGLNVHYQSKNSRKDIVHEDEVSHLHRLIAKKCALFGSDEPALARYAYNYAHAWNIYYSNILLDSYEKYNMLSDRDKIEFYYNISDYFEEKIRSPTLDYLAEVHFDCVKNYNDTRQNMIEHNIAVGEFNLHKKIRKLNSKYYRL